MLRMIAMARHARTGFDKFFGAPMKSRSFAKSYADARAEVDAIDRMIRALDAAREKSRRSNSHSIRQSGAATCSHLDGDSGTRE
jgi:hypothetical protein